MVELKDLQEGDRVSVRFDDGTTLMNARVQVRDGWVWALSLQYGWTAKLGRDNNLVSGTTELFDHKAKKPKWDRPEVMYLIGRNNPGWKAVRDTVGGVPTLDQWILVTGGSVALGISTRELKRRGDWRVMGVSPSE